MYFHCILVMHKAHETEPQRHHQMTLAVLLANFLETRRLSSRFLELQEWNSQAIAALKHLQNTYKI